MLNRVDVLEISNYLKLEYTGSNRVITNVFGIAHLKKNSLSFINRKGYTEDISVGGLEIVNDEYDIQKESKNSYIISENPRLDFVKIFNNFFKPRNEIKISHSIVFGENSKIGKNVTIGEYCVIGDNVIIGDDTILNNHVVIEANTIIGDNCYIKSGAIIGEDGFGFERDENNIPLRFPHIGNVVIGNNVEIGAKTTIARGALESTIIKDNVKINDQVHIAHNTVIDEKTLIAGCVNISGSVFIGKECWISSNSTIKDGVSIGNNAFIGIASIITKNIKDNEKTATISNLSYKDIVKYKKLVK